MSRKLKCFIWEGDSCLLILSWVNWKTVMAFKNNGGLGIDSHVAFNETLLLK